MKWLMYCAEFPPANSTGAIRPARFSKYLARYGEDVRVITCKSSGCFDTLLNDIGNLDILRCDPINIPFINDKGLHFSLGSFFTLLREARAFKPDVLFVSVPFFFPAIVVLLVSMITKVPFCIDYRDLWYFDPYPVRSKKDRVFRWVGKLVEPFLLRKALFVSFVSEYMKFDQLENYKIENGPKYITASTGYDKDEITAVKQSLTGSNGNYHSYISHVGMLDGDMNIEQVKLLLQNEEVLHELRKQELKLLFVGAKEKIIRNYLASIDSDVFEVRGTVSKREALIINAQSFGTLILGSNEKQRLNRKVFEVVNLARRIFYIGNPKSPTAEVLSKYSESYVVSGEDSLQQLVSNFVDFLKSSESSEVDPGIEYFSKDRIIERYLHDVGKLI